MWEKNKKIKKKEAAQSLQGLVCHGKKAKKNKTSTHTYTQQSKLNAGDTDSLNLKEHGASGG